MATMRKFVLSGILMVACAVASVRAQGIPGYTPTNYYPPTPEWRGQAGMTFLQVGGSARGEAMGGAFIAVKGDPSTIFYNPAGMAHLPRFSVYANHTSWLADMSVNHFVAAFNPGPFTIGVSMVSMDYGQIEATEKADNPAGFVRLPSFSPSAYALGVFYAMPLIDRFNFGVQVKYVKQDLGTNRLYTFIGTPGWKNDKNGNDVYSDNEVGAFAVDLGTQYITGFRNVTVNMSLRHFASPQTYVDDAAKFDLPLTYQAGLSSEVIQLVTGLESPTHKVYLAIDGVNQRDVTLDVAAGIEYIVDLSTTLPGTSVSLRAGRRPSRNQEGWLSVGGGINFQISSMAARLDYAYNDYGPHLTASNVGLALQIR